MNASLTHSPQMLATLTDERDLGDDWSLERKLDGVRCLAFVRAGSIVLRSRNRLPIVYPAIARALELLGNAIVDGTGRDTDHVPGATVRGAR